MMNQLICLEPRKFEWRFVPKPIRKSGEILIKIKFLGICGTDLHAFDGNQPFFNYPRVLGHEIAAEIVEMEEDEKDFFLGDQVSVIPYLHCGKCHACLSEKTNCCTSLSVLGVHQDGAMCEFLSLPKKHLTLANNLPLEHVAMVEPLAIGAHGIRRAGVKAGSYVLVIGAGPIGLAAMAFARIKGAHVIALDFNQNRLDFCQKEWQVNEVINGKEDVFQRLHQITAGVMPEFIIDATGNQNAINTGFKYMSHAGTYVLIGLQLGEVTFSHPDFHKKEGTLMSSRNANVEDFEFVLTCLKNQQIDLTKYVNHQIPFSQLMEKFADISMPENKVIKAIVKF
jgi:2-desacetyl-2-hydroxyethyl bacteriochlorophyllide A dehydrogenase